MITVYKVIGNVTRPVAVQCEVFKYPHVDADHDTIYDDTHFATEAEACERLLREREAHLDLSARELRNLQRRVENVTKETAEAGCLMAETRVNHKRWIREQEKKGVASNGQTPDVAT